MLRLGTYRAHGNRSIYDHTTRYECWNACQYGVARHTAERPGPGTPIARIAPTARARRPDIECCAQASAFDARIFGSSARCTDAVGFAVGRVRYQPAKR